MSRSTKRKHVFNEILQGDFAPLSPSQQIVRVLGSRGNYIHEVEAPDLSTFLVSMPSKYRNNVWIKRGDYIVVESIDEGDKVKAEMVKPVTKEHIKFLKSANSWPSQFSEKNERNATGVESNNLINPNRKVFNDSTSEESD